MNKYSLELIETLLKNLNSDGWEDFPEPKNKNEEKILYCADDFWATLLKVGTKGNNDKEKESCFRYAYAKIYAFYNNVKGWYCDAYIWEKEANTFFPKINVGTYCLVRDFMHTLEGYRDGRI